MRSFTIISFLVATAVAQQAPVKAASPLIPNGISDGCKSALQGFDTDTSLQGCTASIIAATKDYTSGAKTASAAGMTSALDTLAATTSCSEPTFRTILAQFYQSCQTELTSSPNKDVISLYEVIYMLSPFKTAVSSKDDSGKYCALQIAERLGNATGSTGSGSAKTNLVVTGEMSPVDVRTFLSETVPQMSRRADTTSSPISIVNITTFADANVLFLFLNTGLDAATLCTSCTRSIMTAYIDFESDVPFAPLKSDSLMLSGQLALYNGIQATCGKTFLGGAVQAAGGLGSGISGKLSGGAASSSVSVGGSLTLGLGVMTLLAAFL